MKDSFAKRGSCSLIATKTPHRNHWANKTKVKKYKTLCTNLFILLDERHLMNCWNKIKRACLVKLIPYCLYAQNIECIDKNFIIYHLCCLHQTSYQIGDGQDVSVFLIQPLAKLLTLWLLKKICNVSETHGKCMHLKEFGNDTWRNCGTSPYFGVPV